MSLTSFDFFLFLFLVVLLFYLIKPAQKYILLAASIYFYISASSIDTMKLLLIIAYMIAVTYGGALLIEKAKGKWKNIVLALSISAVVAVLVVLKYAYNLATTILAIINMNTDVSWLHFAAVMGLSYYALSAIGYLIDVCWGAYAAERNVFDVALFIFYFPQIISGPVTRFLGMKEQLNTRRTLDYENITVGLRRILWGYFKKLVISERFAVVVGAVYGGYSEYSFIGILAATLCYAVQLYTDFSGCMDIIMGVSKLFGVDLPENFNAPFFSQSIQEFWQRWHITLGGWFKDYVMYPLQKSKPMITLGKWSKKKLGKKLGKKIPFYISMIVLWLLIGVWHGGTGYYFIASAFVPCAFLMISDFTQPLIAKGTSLLKINTECASWRFFRGLRTELLLCICWIFVCAGGTGIAVDVMEHMLTTPIGYTSLASAFTTFNLNAMDMFLMTVGVIVLFVADYWQYKGSSIFKKVDEQNFFFRVVLIYLEVLAILLYGMVGNSSFIYFKF